MRPFRLLIMWHKFGSEVVLVSIEGQGNEWVVLMTHHGGLVAVSSNFHVSTRSTHHALGSAVDISETEERSATAAVRQLHSYKVQTRHSSTSSTIIHLARRRHKGAPVPQTRDVDPP